MVGEPTPGSIWLWSDISERRGGGGMTRTPWDDLQGRLRAGQMVRHWSAAKGYLTGVFRVTRVAPDRVIVNSQSMQSGSVTISRADFETVARVWPRYSAGAFPRHRLAEISRTSTYIISLLHWLEAEGNLAHDMGKT